MPILKVEYSADEAVFPTDIRQYSTARGSRCEDYLSKGAMHFPYDQPEGDQLIGKLADVLVEWAK